MKEYEQENIRLAQENRQLRRENAILLAMVEADKQVANRYIDLVAWIRNQAPTSSTLRHAKSVIESCVQAALERGKNVV